MDTLRGTGAQILVRSLARHGVERISCVAGESYLAVLDALLDHPEIKVFTCRHEGGAAFMAESWGKLYGDKPGICFVTRGPGACNATIGVHTAMQDSTPMILFIGQAARGDLEREAFQEINVREMFGSLCKWAVEISDASRIPEIVHRAMKTAVSGRPGPVVITLPEDMLTDETSCTLTPAFKPVRPHPAKEEVAAICDMIQRAQRPLAIVGGTGWTDEACAQFMDFAQTCHLPVASSFRRQDIFNHRNSCYVGELGTGPNPKLVAKVKEADLLLVIGSRLSEITTQNYTLLDIPVPRQQIIHVHPAESELGKVHVPALSVQADYNSLTSMLAGGAFRIDGRSWGAWKEELRAQYQDWTAIDPSALPAWKGANMTAIFAWLRENLPDDAVVTTDAGNFSGWAQRYLYYGRPGRLLAPTSGAMGYAVPSAVGASLAFPGRTVLGLCGDGGFMMTGQELATALHHGATPVIMVCNNGMYGTIRMHQEKHYPGRISATSLSNPDFTALAASYGVFTAGIDRAEDFPAAWQAARASGKAALLEIRMDPRQITTNAKP